MGFLATLRTTRNRESSLTEPKVRWVLWFAVGLFIGNIVLVALRVDYYGKMGYQSEMGPAIAFLFIPVLFLPHLLIALFFEWLARKFWSKSHHELHSFLIGGCYATLLFWWAFPDHAYLAFVFNPLVLRWAINVLVAKRLRPENTTS